MEIPSRIHLDRIVDVVLAVSRGAGLFSLLALSHDPMDHTVQLRAEREANVVGDEDRHLLQLVDREFTVGQNRVDLYLQQRLLVLRSQHRQQHHPPVTHRQTRPHPYGSEEVFDRQVEVLVALPIRHLPRVYLVHLGEALLAHVVHAHSSLIACGTPRPAARFFSASSANGRSTPTVSPSASASFRSFSPRAAVCWNGW